MPPVGVIVVVWPVPIAWSGGSVKGELQCENCEACGRLEVCSYDFMKREEPERKCEEDENSSSFSMYFVVNEDTSVIKMGEM
ncbi:hypothetical protein M5K25_020062 [Dendrobium thyrsiflorum]|uniref:Uncharacterized protein n=1 Tax=Dendrobium thyrsiflorum TaxID=117978 RepID=A0ABD0U9L4_DENTH